MPDSDTDLVEDGLRPFIIFFSQRMSHKRTTESKEVFFFSTIGLSCTFSLSLAFVTSKRN